MERYLQYCVSHLNKLNQFDSIGLVIGNESCDLDSAVSAVVLAYVKHHHQPDENAIVLPILNVPREDVKLRREIVFWFEQVLQYNLSLLPCRDQIDYAQLDSSKVHITLVDHNDNRELARLLPQAVFHEIIDHHQPAYAPGACQVTDTTRVHIDTGAGSCSSLVALRFLACDRRSKFGEESEPEINFDSQIALMLYGPILLDTICFNHSAKRFNVKDYEAVNKLEDLLKHSSEAEASLFDRNEVYQRLMEARNSLDGLSFTELLRKDMKIVESSSDNNLAICISSLTGTLLTEMSLKDRLGEMKSFCDNPPSSAIFSYSRPRMFNAIVLMSLDDRIPNNLRRQLSLYCTNKHLMRTIATCIEKSDLELELITASESLRMYNQNNLSASRKAVLPIISTILNGPGSQPREERRVEGGEPSSSILSAPSAPSSLIQQPDSYYGSYIEDSFVGDLVGEYDNGDNSGYQPLRLDEELHNLVIMNPNDNGCMSHPHDIEFGFDSFGPESIIYSDNADPARRHKLNRKPQEAEDKLDEQDERDKSELEKSGEGDSGFDKDNTTLTDSHDKSHSPSLHTENESEVKETVSIGKEESLQEKLTYSESNTSSMSDHNAEESSQEEKKHEPKDEASGNVKLNGETMPSATCTPNNHLSTFSRNSTLTRSQRRKILPQVNIKNLIITSDAFSPPPAIDVNPNLLASSSETHDSTFSSIGTNGHREAMEENFIVSSQQLNESNNKNILDPLNASALNDAINSPGLLRQPSIRKKVPVNYNMILHDQFEDSGKKEESSEAKGQTERVEEKNTVAPTTEMPPMAVPPSQLDSLSALTNGAIDMRIIEPFRAVISHGGFLHATVGGEVAEGASSPVVIVFNACHLPERSRVDYNYVMENLFMYVLSTLHNMIADDYVLIYLHNGGNLSQGGASINNMPTFTWLKRSYQMIDRKLKKNLKALYLVHPTFWLKTLIVMSKPFISSKFSRKLKFVRNLEELKSAVPLDNVNIPESVSIYDKPIKLSTTRS